MLDISLNQLQSLQGIATQSRYGPCSRPSSSLALSPLLALLFSRAASQHFVLALASLNVFASNRPGLPCLAKALHVFSLVLHLNLPLRSCLSNLELPPPPTTRFLLSSLFCIVLFQLRFISHHNPSQPAPFSFYFSSELSPIVCLAPSGSALPIHLLVYISSELLSLSVCVCMRVYLFVCLTIFPSLFSLSPSRPLPRR